MTDKQDKEFIRETAELIWKWKFATQEAWENRPLEAETKEVQTYFRLQAEELIAKAKAHYEPLIQKAVKAEKEKIEKAFIWGQVPYFAKDGTVKEWTMRCISDKDWQAIKGGN